MTTTADITTDTDDQRFVSLAAEIGEVAAAHAEGHDRAATFATEAYDAMRAGRYLHMPVPVELGGLGASMRQICFAQAELAKHDGATALAATMHLYNTMAQVFRYRKGAADAEGVLRRVVDEDLVIGTSGGSDWLWPSTIAVADDGGYRVSGRKMFCSQAPVADVITTCAVLGEPGPGSEVLHFAVPLGADGVHMEETWDTLGMRATASHDIVLEDVWVPAERIVARRPWGEYGVPLLLAALHFAPVAGATYHGIAVGARDRAVAGATSRLRGTTSLSELPRVQRQVGLMDSKLQVAWWALMGSVADLGDDHAADPTTVASVMVAKRHAVLEAIEVVDLAMDVLGGRSYFRSGGLERAYRDVRAGTFHPFNPEVTLSHVGQLALGGTGETE